MLHVTLPFARKLQNYGDAFSKSSSIDGVLHTSRVGWLRQAPPEAMLLYLHVKFHDSS